VYEMYEERCGVQMGQHKRVLGGCLFTDFGAGGFSAVQLFRAMVSMLYVDFVCGYIFWAGGMEDNGARLVSCTTKVEAAYLDEYTHARRLIG